MANTKSNPLQMYRIDGQNCFVEFMAGMLDKGKVNINFCEYDPKNGNKQTSRIDIYVDSALFLGWCEGVLSGEFDRMIAADKESGWHDGQKVSQYTAWFSSMGGINEDDTKRRLEKLKELYPWVSDGIAISRQFKVQESTKYKYVFRGEVGIGKSNDKGLIVPQGMAKKYTQIPVRYDDVMGLCAVCRAYITAYYNQHIAQKANDLWKNQYANVDFGHLAP